MFACRVSLLRVVSLLGIVGAAACSMDSDSSGALVTGEQNVSTIVQAAVGATLALEDGTRVVIPAGVLESDAEVGLSRETCEGVYATTRFKSCVYRVSAPDAALVGRYTVLLPSRGETGVPTDCAVALTDDGWRCLVDTETSDEAAEASASAFTDFAIRASSDDLADDRCTDVPFEPCGGDLLGNWTLMGTCGSMQEVLGVTFSFDSSPYEACDPFDHYMDYPFSIEGALEFHDDGVLRTLEAFQISGHTLVTEECLAEVGEECGDDCILESGVCDCLSLSSAGQGGTSAEWTPGEPGTFRYYEQAFEYCVNGDRLTVEFPGYGGATHFRVYERSAPELLSIGSSDCERDNQCETGVCWDFHDYDSLCGGSVCSLECGTDFDCQAAADEAGGSDPAAARCGEDGKCDLVGTGLGSFVCS
jgi:hypothetical protein